MGFIGRMLVSLDHRPLNLNLNQLPEANPPVAGRLQFVLSGLHVLGVMTAYRATQVAARRVALT